MRFGIWALAGGCTATGRRLRVPCVLLGVDFRICDAANDGAQVPLAAVRVAREHSFTTLRDLSATQLEVLVATDDAPVANEM